MLPRSTLGNRLFLSESASAPALKVVMQIQFVWLSLDAGSDTGINLNLYFIIYY